LLILLWIGSSLLYSQDTNIHRFKLGASFSGFWKFEIDNVMSEDGDPDFSGEGFYTVGIVGQYAVKKHLSLETGLIIGQFMANITPYNPNDPSFSENIPLLYIPVTLRANFLKYIYAGGGLLVDFDLGNSQVIDKQTGIGATLGAGFSYDFPFGLTVFANPYINVHSIVSFSNGPLSDKFIESGGRVGVLMKL
jgi:hypothetical protein